MSYILRLKSFVFIVGLLILVSSCSAPIGDHHPEWKKYFDEYRVTGCIEIYDQDQMKFIDYDPDRCAQRFIPASTFKICNSIIALETKAIPDTSYVIKWDSVVRNIASWNHDQSMMEAFHNSTVWYYQDAARRIGSGKMQQYLQLLHYGNMLMGSTIDSFWLTGDLRISCDEQIEFLKNFYTGQLPVSKRTTDLVKGMMILEKTPGYTLSGKTGWGTMKRESDPGYINTPADSSRNQSEDVNSVKNIGWFVGYVEKGDDVYFFATNIESGEPAPGNFADARKEITKKILREMKILD